MEQKKKSKSKTGLLLLLLLAVVALALFLEESPMNYKKLFKLDSEEKTNSSTQTQVSVNDDYRTKLQSGGSIALNYNYIPSERCWDTMYTYNIYRTGSSGDCTFYCTRNTLEDGSEDLCSCLYSEQIWNELVDLVLTDQNLQDCTSVYDVNGKVVDTSIEKTVSFAGGVFVPYNMDEIEAYFKKLAVNAGVESSELDKNIKINDASISDRSSITDLNGDFVYKPGGVISDEEKEKLENHIWDKYRETGVRMYIILYSSDDTDLMGKVATQQMNRATSPAVVFGITSSKKSWIVRYTNNLTQNTTISESYGQIAEAYESVKGDNVYEKLIKAIDKAYEIVSE